ncbi:MAG: zinc finger domain-containing protein, partial [Wenzhouxiangella sp.]
IALTTKATVPGIDEGKFQELAENAKAGCPVSRLFAAAEITLEGSGKLGETLAELGDELRFVLISADVHLAPVSEAMEQADLMGDTLKVAVEPSKHAKCIRCWHHRDSVGSNPDHPEICDRCVDNVTTAGETRRWA